MHPYATNSEERTIVPFYIAGIAIAIAWVAASVAGKVRLPFWVEVPGTATVYGLLFGVFRSCVLSRAGLLRKWNGKLSKKGTGFEQPPQPHEHWHIDVSYLNVCATFYYLCSILDGYSRFLVHWDLREQMTEADIEIILERAKERYSGVKPRVISDNGPQFIAKDFKEFIRISGMTHVRTSPYYPQSNGKIERWHKSLKGECIRPGTPLSLEDARRLVQGYVEHYNNVRLNSAIGYITPKDMLAGHQQEIQAEQRKNRRQRAA